jgi:hypothetical protein
MAVTDQTILEQMQRVTLEGTGDLGLTWPSGMWTLAEILGYLNQRQDRFLAATGLLWKRLETAITLAQSDQANPTDWVATVFIAYKTGAGLYRELPKLDALELDFKLPTWPGASSATPRGYYEIDGNTLTTYVVPIPTDAGSALERYYIALGTALTQNPAVNFSVPDEFVPTIKYGALAEMFGKVGQAHNPVLAAACEARWEEGVEVGRIMATEGWFAL